MSSYYSLYSNVFVKTTSSADRAIITSNLPGSATSFISKFQMAISCGVMVNETVLVSPGLRLIFSNPFKAITGVVTEFTLFPKYICTTSLPATLPVLLTSTDTCTCPPLVNDGADTCILLYLNEV